MTNKINQLAQELNLRAEIDYQALIVYLFKPTPRAKHSKEKQVYGVQFKSLGRLVEVVTNHLQSQIDVKNARAKAKAEEKIKNDKLAAEVQVGDIFVCSWGYEQTNVNFYQVVENPTAKTVKVREIKGELIEDDGYGSMSGRVKPRPNVWAEEEVLTKRLAGDSFKVNSYSHARKTDPSASHYRSWYA